MEGKGGDACIALVRLSLPKRVGAGAAFIRVGFFHTGAAGAVWVSGGDAPFLAPSGSLSIADGEGWGEAAPPASLLVRPKNLPLSKPA